MTIGPGDSNKKEIIGGLMNHLSVQDTYGMTDMKEEKALILRVLEQLHQLMADFHFTVIDRCWQEGPRHL